MLCWKRPQAHSTFDAEAAELLSDLRSDVGKNAGRAKTEHFEKRSLWTYSWRRASQPTGIHRTTLVGPLPAYAKCVWCEQYRETRRELDVEHYRPKVSVTEWQGSPSTESDTPPREVNERGGYWWLAFAWSNFALSCKTCNQGWKRNLFPVRTTRVADVAEGDELVEEPLLLDPSRPFRTRDHFRWTATGLMVPVSDEGRATIITCGLNRADLLQVRQQVAQNVQDLCGRFNVALRKKREDDQKRLWSELRRVGADTAEFAGMARWFVEERCLRGAHWDDVPGLS